MTNHTQSQYLYGTDGTNATALSGLGGSGGIGYTTQSGTLTTTTNIGSITGGEGGTGGAGNTRSPAGGGGSGGVGVLLTAGTLVNSPVSTELNGGVIYGGQGGFGGQNPSSGADGPGGAGGVGVEFASGATLTNMAGGLIEGGHGGDGGGDEKNFLGDGGIGGIGVLLSASSTLNNYSGAIIAGGIGGYGGNAGGSGATGGTGVSVAGGVLLNTGTIQGGRGGDSARLGSPTPGEGGAGVYLNGGVVVSYGTISGGTGGGGNSTNTSSGLEGDAVQFGPSAGKLEVGAGAVFNGQVAASGSVNDTLELLVTQSGGTAITLGTQFTGFQTLDFAAGAQWAVDVGAGAATAHTLTIDGFAVGDTLDITNQTPTQVAGDFGVTVRSLGGGSYDFNGTNNPQFTSTADGTAIFNGDFSGKYFILTPDAHGGTDVTLSDAACFRSGTQILSERGEVAIETLRIGDRIVTLSGTLETIRWIGRRTYTREAAVGNTRLMPIRIRAGALGEDLPKRDLWVSPEHAMYVDGLLIPAGALLNGVSIVREPVVEELNYIHLEFDSHQIVFGEGAPSESFVDDDSREMFDNAAEFSRLYPHRKNDTARLCAPRVEEGWELEEVRKRLVERATLTAIAGRPPRAALHTRKALSPV